MQKLDMTKQQIIDKYNLKKYDEKNSFTGKVYFDLWQNSTEKDGIQMFYSLDNQMSVDLDNGKTYFLHIQTINNNKLKYNKQLGYYVPTTTNRVYLVEV